MITKDMTTLDIVEKYPKTEKIFHEYDKITGKCLLCNNLFDTVEVIAANYELNLAEILDRLNSEEIK